MHTLSIAEFARRDGCSRTAVQKAIKSGHLIPQPDGKLTPDLVGTGWRKRNRVAQQVAGAGNPAKVAERILAVQGAPWSQAEAERVKENFLAKLRQLEFDERAGRLLSVNDVEETVGRMFDHVRARLLAIPAKAGALLAGRPGMGEVHGLLTDLIYHALNELAATEVVVERIEGRSGRGRTNGGTGG